MPSFAHCRARIRRIGLGALLAALSGGAFDAHAQFSTHLESYRLTDPHGAELTVGGSGDSRLFFGALDWPYFIVTAVQKDTTATLWYRVRGVGLPDGTPVQITSGLPVKIRLPLGSTGLSVDLHQNGEFSLGDAIFILGIRARTSGGIPDDPVMAAPVVGDSSLAISWTAPADINGAAITGYKIRWATAAAPATYLNTGGAAGADAGGASATTHTITGLTNDTAYGVEVAAVNSHGTGGWADVQLGTPGTPGTPDAPRNLTAVVANAKLKLSWLAPQNTGGADIEKYRVRWSEGADSTNWIDPPGAAGGEVRGGADARKYTVTGLTNGTTYTVQVAAENSNGAGEWASQNAEPMPVPPGMPQSLASQIANRALLLSWVAPDDDGGAAISDYKVRWRNFGASSWTNPAGASTGADLSHTLSGLTNGIIYEVQVAAANRLGAGAWSASHRNTPKAVPGMPRNLSVTGNSGRLNLNWSAPATDSGAALSEYVVRWAEGAGSISWVTPPGASGRATSTTATTYTLRDLKSATTYEVQLAARNANGLSAWTTSAQGATSIFDMDVNQSGAVDAPDGTLIERYLAGTRGAALLANLNAPAAADAVDANIAAAMAAGNFDVDDSGAVNGTDGMLVARYLLGVTGDSLRAGLTDTGLPAVVANITALQDELNVNAAAGVEWHDGVLIARHMFGLRGAALTAGLGSPLLLPADVAAHINAGVTDGVLDVDDSGTTEAADGIMISRYLQGVRGAAVTAGQT
ncbi:MAG: fibronectin type III domain-containing protein, partial [Gammaproteobacteria bacterium]